MQDFYLQYLRIVTDSMSDKNYILQHETKHEKTIPQQDSLYFKLKRLAYGMGLVTKMPSLIKCLFPSIRV